MPKRQSKTNIPLNALDVFRSKRDICEVCENQIDDDKKLLVWDDAGDVHGYACTFCKTIYDKDDELTKISIGDSDILYEA
jgi:hypothetical protein|tara:strand:- start:4847 stop:5086 length:240 start_codon:yes stop_codon:yes gene_type:complete